MSDGFRRVSVGLRSPRAHVVLAACDAGWLAASVSRVVGRVASSSHDRRLRVEAEVVEDGHDRLALVDFGDDVATPTAGAGENVIQIDSP